MKDKRKGYYRIFPEDWQVASVGSLLKRIKDPVEVSPSTTYREIGIRSHGKGIFHKKEVLGEVLGNKSVFWVKPDCFVVNIVFAWELAVAKTTADEDGFIASHRFPMYTPLEGKLDLDFLLYYFRTPFGKLLLNLASPGGAGRNKTLGQTEFSKLKLCIPQKIKEQQKIAEILSTWNDAIRLKQELIDQKKAQKKGLMQLLLTGKIRVTEMGKLSSADIKKRVAEIQQDIVPEGYQKTKVGIIPKEWRIERFSKLFDFDGGFSFSRKEYSEKGICCLHYGDIHKSEKNFIDIAREEDCIPKINIDIECIEEKKLLGDGDIVFADASEDYEGIGKSVVILNKNKTPFIAGLHTIVAKSKEDNKEVDRDYKRFFLMNSSVKKQFCFFATGISVFGISKSNIKKITFPLPSLPEQQKIAEILSTTDKEIELLKTELKHLNTQKKGLMQLLLTGKIRVNDMIEKYD